MSVAKDEIEMKRHAERTISLRCTSSKRQCLEKVARTTHVYVNHFISAASVFLSVREEVTRLLGTISIE